MGGLFNLEKTMVSVPYRPRIQSEEAQELGGWMSCT